MRTTINEMYSDLSPSLQDVVNRILCEARYSSASSSYLIGVANKLIKFLVESNPENDIVQGVFISSIPGDITNEDLDWETTFDRMNNNQTIFDVVAFFFFKPLIEYLLGIKIENNLNKDQRRAIGLAIAIAAIKHFATITVDIEGRFKTPAM